MMNATYKGKAYRVGEDVKGKHIVLIDAATNEQVLASYGDQDLVVDCTDAEFFACVNVQGGPWVPETRQGWVVRNAAGLMWFLQPAAAEESEYDAFEAAGGYLLDQGGQMFEVSIEMKVVSAKLVDSQEDESGAAGYGI